jgi:Flp pilus assembly protein TadG
MKTNKEANGARDKRTGTATIELALLLPLLLLIALGAIDFGRVFYMSVEVANAARAGVQYGAQSTATSQDYPGMVNAAKNDAPDISGMTASATRWCECSGSSTTFDCSQNNCLNSNPKVPEIYVQVSTQATFNTMMKYPGIPTTILLSKQATMRVQ